MLEVAFIAAIVVVTLMVFHTHDSRSNFVGIFCVVFGVLMYASPLTVMVRALLVFFLPPSPYVPLFMYFQKIPNILKFVILGLTKKLVEFFFLKNKDK